MPTLKELREKRSKAVSEARKIYDKAQAEKREMNAEETQQFDRFRDEERQTKTEIEALEKTEGRSSWLQESEEELRSSAGRRTNPIEPQTPGRLEERKGKAVEFELRGKKYSAPEGSPMYRRNQDEVLEEVRNYIRSGTIESRDLQMDLSTAGGYIVTPEKIHAELIRTVDNATPFRQRIRKFTVLDAASLGVPTLTDRISSRTRGSELASPTADTTMKFGKRSLTPSPTTGLIKVSRDLLRVSSMNPEQIVQEEIAYEEAVGLEQEYMTGSGANAPLGVFTAHADGISTARDISTGNTTTAPTFDGLIRAKMALKPQYRAKASWLFHRDVVTVIMLIKDGNGQYIWQPSKQDGDPDRLLGLPVDESEYAPNTLTTAQYVGLVGDMSHYWHVDQIGLEIQRLVELYAATNQVGFMYRAKNDAAPMKAEAFARVKLA
jgi:HK97 family phage major capsid protein